MTLLNGITQGEIDELERVAALIVRRGAPVAPLDVVQDVFVKALGSDLNPELLT